MNRPSFATVLCGFLLALFALRMAIVATNLNNLHNTYPEEQEQANLTIHYFDNLPEAKPLKFYWRNILQMLPAHKQFHGIFLLNNTLVYCLTLLIGWHYANLHLIALFYVLVVYVLWALLIHHLFGMRAFVFFSILTLAAPVKSVCSSLYLIGSHNEGNVLIAMSFFLVFYNRKAWIKYLFFALFGVFFFFYKGSLLLLPILLLPAIRSLTDNRQRFAAIALFAAGFIPMELFQLAFGFHSHLLSDSYVPPDGPSLFNLFKTPQISWNVWHLPTCGAPALRWLLSALCVFGAIHLLYLFARQKSKQQMFILTVVGFPLLFFLVLMSGNISSDLRYYWLLNPFIPVVIGLSLSRLPLKFGAPALLCLAAIMLPAQLSLIQPQNGLLFLRYKTSIDYPRTAINYVPAAETDFVDWWAVQCPENRGFNLMYQYVDGRECMPNDPPLRFLGDCKIDPDLPQIELSDNEAISVGMVLGLRLRGDDATLADWAEQLKIPTAQRPLLAVGFERMQHFSPQMNCQGELPAAAAPAPFDLNQ